MSFFPGWAGRGQVRLMELEGDRLTLVTAPGRAGGQAAHRLVWERVGERDTSPTRPESVVENRYDWRSRV